MTDYDKLIRDDDPYTRLIQGDQAQALRGAMAGAAATQPDVEAKLRQLSKQVGVPLDSVRLDPPQAERQAAIGAIDYNRLVRESPVTANFLTENAAVARDDVGTLTRIERAFTAMGQGVTKGSLQEDLGPLHYKAFANTITPAEQARRKQLDDQMKALDALPEKGDSPLSWFLNVTGYTARQMVTSVKEAAPGALAGATAGAAVGGLAAPVAPVTATGGAILGARAGYITMSTVYNYKTEAGFAFDEFEKLKTVDGKPMPPDVARGAAAAVGLLNAGLETVGELALLKLVPGLDKLMAGGAKQAVKTLLQRPTFRAAIAEAGKKWVKAASIEGLTEGLQEITVILGRELAQGVTPGQYPATPIGQDVARVAQAAAEGAAGAAGVGAPAAGYRGYRNIREVQAAQRNQDFMTALGESAQASKLRERLPEAFREFVKKAREGGPVENVYIPADQFARYFQSQNVDPAAVAAEVGAANFAEAAAAGTDVVIPLENYAEKIAATQHHAGLMQDVKLHQGDLTMREAKAMEQRQQEMQAELEAMIERESGKQAPAVEQIKQDVMGELVGRFERGTADAYATTYAKTIATLAQRSGIDPMELHRTYGLRVVTPLPAILQQQPNIDTAIDPLLDRLRAGEIPSEVQSYGPSLYEFIRDRGGLKPVGETRMMDENITRRAFERKLSQEKGLSLDYALEAAVEAGYFMGREPGTLGETEMLNALDEDIAGNRIYSPQFRNENLAGLRDQLLALDEYLQQLGGDLTMDNAALKALILKAAQVSPDDDQVYAQKGKPRDDYTADLFGVPAPAGEDSAAEGSAAGRLQRPLSRDDAPGQYATRTQIVEETTRVLGADKVTTVEQAAQALAYLGRNAVERFDALITDKDGKPLAIVGSFKGALAQASIYPATVASEAFRINGAANIWFAHNHPSGDPSLSRADENLMQTLREVFRGSEITAHGLFAIAGTEKDERAWSYFDGLDMRGGVAKPGKTVKVPAVERVIAEGGKLGRAIDSPVTAKAAAIAMSNGQSGALLMDTHHVPVAFVPIEPDAAAKLRTGGRMDALWRALSMSNAGSVILVNHGGAYDNATVRNLGGFFKAADARVLDVMDVSASGVQSYAERGLDFANSTFYQPAFHGTPHRGITKFSTDKIGTGEGAQAYGWGLYFASQRDIAEFYRKKLSSRGPATLEQSLGVPMDQADALWAAARVAAGDLQSSMTPEALLQARSASIRQLPAEQRADLLARAIQVYRSPAGQLYEVDIPEDSEMLLWDKPLSEQSDSVRAATIGLLQVVKNPDPAYSDEKWLVAFESEDYRDSVGAFSTKREAEAARPGMTGRQLYSALESFKGPRGASMFLAERGIKGIKYLDGGSRTAGDGSYNYVVFSGDDVAIRNQFYQADDGDKRGFIQFGADRKFTIGLLEKADLSTFLHETGHFWLEVLGDLAERPDAAEQIKADYQTLLDWFGVKSRAEITVEHHEMFARANEAYLMEGKAPSPELRSIFQRFRAWLSMIYRTMQRLNVQLNDDVRGVLDRIYATDEEIEAAKRQLDAVPLFTSAAEAGMTEGEFAAYRKTVEAASEAAKEKLQGELMREYQRAREKWWKEKRAAMRLDVEAEVDATPVYQAFAALVDGKLPDGTPIKLSKDDLVRRYGEEYLKRLPRGFQRIYTAEGGTRVDVAAEALGFESGTALIEALVNMRPRKDLIEAETDARMAREYGDMMLDGTIAEEAMQAIHNEERAKVIAAELRALSRQRRVVQPVLAALSREEQQARQTALDIPPVSVFRAAAAGRIGQMQAKDINPYQYLLAERRASKAAYEAAAKKDYVAAATEKQRELMNHYLYLEAVKAKQEIDKVYAYMGRFEKSAAREKLAKAGGGYLDQIDAILERYEFKRISMTALAKRQSLLEFVQDMESQGLLVNIPDALLDEARRVNYRQATVDELRAVRDTVKNIEHLATLKDKLLRKREALEFAAVKAELIESARDNFKATGELGKPNRKGETIRDRGARLWKWFDAKHLKVEQLVEWLDGGKIDGPWARYLFDLAADAQTKEYELHAMVTAKLQELAASMPKEWRESLADKTGVTLPGLDGPVTRYTLLSLALNAGNASNLQRLRDGYGWSDATVASALGQLTAEDARFVQGVWDTVNSLWPEIVALEKRVTGIAPEKVEATPVTIGGVEVAGGYFPLVYDSRLSAVGEKQAEATESVGQFLANAYGRARTDKGYTKQRVETLKAPVLLDFEQVLTSHLTRVIKDVSHREAIYSLNKILKDGEIKAALIETIGEEQYRELNKWTQVLVADRADTLHQATGAAKLIMQLRTNMAIVTMGWKISTMMAQFAGFGPSMDLVKPRFLTQALVDFNRYGPWSSHRETLTAMVYEKSGEMKFRADTIERDVRDALRRMQGDNSPLAAIRKTAFYLTAMADRQVTIPTWLGAYRQALAEGQTEESAVRAGDRAVRLSQGAGGSKDLAAVQRDNELMRLLTMYYSPFSVLYARLRDLGHTTRRVEDMPRAVARVMALVILPAVLGDLLAAKGPGDDEDGIWWAIRKALLYPIATIPVVRDLSSYLEAKLISIAGNGEMKFAPSFTLSPVVGAMDKVARTVFMRIPEAAQGQRQWDDVAWDSLEASGYVLGLPTAQVRITGEYITDVLTNQAHPETPQQAMHDLLFKRPPERK